VFPISLPTKTKGCVAKRPGGVRGKTSIQQFESARRRRVPSVRNAAGDVSTFLGIAPRHGERRE